MYVNLKLNKRKAGAVSSQKKHYKTKQNKNSNIPKLDELGPLSPYKSNF